MDTYVTANLNALNDLDASWKRLAVALNTGPTSPDWDWAMEYTVEIMEQYRYKLIDIVTSAGIEYVEPEL